MKRTIILYGTTLAILMVLIVSFTNWNNDKAQATQSSNDKTLTYENQNMEVLYNTTIPDLYYGVDTRFAAIKKSDIDLATSIYDFLNEGEKEQIAHLNSVEVIVIKDNQQSELREYGTRDQLSDAQIQLVRSRDFFNHFTVRTEFKAINKETGKLEERFFGPHITVVPEHLATYVNGMEALITYLKDNSRDAMNVIKGDRLGAIKLSFIVTKEGKVSNVTHDAMTTGYTSIDEKLFELIKNIPGEWTPAENSIGEKIEQELVFTFGPADGC